MGSDDLAPLLGLLLGAARRWSRREPFDEGATEAIRHEAIRRLHRRHVRSLPLYRALAEDRGLAGPQPLETIVDELLVTSDVFKSYDPRWLEQGDFGRMTGWLGERFVRPPRPDLAGVRGVPAWRRRLASDGVFLTVSSGTSGRPSFVPRDLETLRALAFGGRFTIPPLWDDAQADFDCLVLARAGTGRGMDVAARAVARGAVRSHLLVDAERAAEPDDGDYAAALRFLARSVRERRRLLVFGAPAYVAQACRRILAAGPGLRLAPGSVVLTGGGGKGREPDGRDALGRLVLAALGVADGSLVDAYSAAELNVVLMSCPSGRYHVPPTVEVVVLDELLMGCDGEPATGTLGFLDPFALSYPGFVIPGDRATLSRAPCPCGLAGASIVGEIARAAGLEARGCAGVATPVLG
jgi:Acyl-protein synthetase, LuxE